MKSACFNKLAFSDEKIELFFPIQMGSARAVSLGEDPRVPSMCLKPALQGHPMVVLVVGDGPNCVSPVDFLLMQIPVLLTTPQSADLCMGTPGGLRVSRMCCGGAEHSTELAGRAGWICHVKGLIPEPNLAPI